jgi:hypothetical protein
MRIALALVVLLGGTASADAAEPQRWCSNGLDTPAELVESSHGFIMKVAGQPDEYPGDSLDAARIFVQALEDEEGPEQYVYIVRDCIFWPCEQ